MKYSCNLIKDLMPLYHDDVCSDDTKATVEEHLAECVECTNYYHKMCESDIVEVASYDNALELKKADSIKHVKKKIRKKVLIIILIIILAAVLFYSLAIGFIFVLLFLDIGTAKVEVHTDVMDYEKYIGIEAQEEYANKWGMDESIFPKEITDDMEVLDYKMVYYNPWDAQYLSYLTVIYDEQDYKEEVDRLADYESTDYLGNYGVTGFDDEYSLLAMYADDYQGFVYALTDNEDTIVYVEIIFCNYFMDIDYEKYMPKEYFPTGFDASSDNEYRKEMLKDAQY